MSIIDTIFFISIFRPYFCRIEINNKQKTKEKMKEHFQDYGVRRWAGDDLIELQSEPLEAIQRLVEPYAPCIIQGCDLEEEGGTRRIGAGLVALWQVDESGRKQGVKIARFGGCTPSSLPVYLTLQCSTENRVYADGRSKAIAYLYEARETSLEEEARGRYPLVIGPEGGVRLAENLYVGFAGAAERKNIEPGERLSELFGKVRRWFSDMKGLAFKEKVSESDLEAALRGKLEEKVSGSDLEEALRGKVDKESGKGLSGNDFTDALKGKLEGIEAGANRYVHPAYGPATGYPASNQTPGFGSTFSLSQPSRDGNGHVSLTTRTVRIPDTPASRSAAGLMSAADKTKLEGIAAGANNYTHPATAGNKHIPSGGSSGQYLKYSAPGTAAWASPASNLATTSAAGFMSAADKKQLTDFQIVGIYFIATGTIQYGFKSERLEYKQATHGNDKCLRITMPAETGTYMILPLAPQSQYYLTTYENRWSAGNDAIVFHRAPNGDAGYFDFGVGFILVKTTLTLTA